MATCSRASGRGPPGPSLVHQGTGWLELAVTERTGLLDTHGTDVTLSNPTNAVHLSVADIGQRRSLTVGPRRAVLGNVTSSGEQTG
jgi:hypothetical protein